jgi:hypothetical protein
LTHLPNGTVNPPLPGSLVSLSFLVLTALQQRY